MPKDLAKQLGGGGIAELLSVLWKGYDKAHSEGAISPDMSENRITQEWALRVQTLWYEENRASRLSINLYPTTQHEDYSMAKARGQAPTIDFCFRTWSYSESYFGAECKNLYEKDNKHIKRYVDTGVRNYISGKYGSRSSVSSLVGYVLSGKIPKLVGELECEIAKTSPRLNISRDIGSADPQYKSRHIRLSDGEIILIYHLLFDFTV